MTLSLVTTSRLCPLGPGWPFKGVRAEQAVGPIALFSEGPGVKTESSEGPGGGVAGGGVAGGVLRAEAPPHRC